MAVQNVQSFNWRTVLLNKDLNIHLGVCDLNGDKAKLLPEVSSKIELVNFNCGRVMNSITPLKIKMKAEQYDCLVATQTHTNIVAGIAKKLAGVANTIDLP